MNTYWNCTKSGVVPPASGVSPPWRGQSGNVWGLRREHEVMATKWVIRYHICIQPPLELQTYLREVWSFTITEKAPTRSYSWLKAHTSAFIFKNLNLCKGSFLAPEPNNKTPAPYLLRAAGEHRQKVLKFKAVY